MSKISFFLIASLFILTTGTSFSATSEAVNLYQCRGDFPAIKKAYLALNNEMTRAFLLGDGYSGDEYTGSVDLTDDDFFLILVGHDYDKCAIRLNPFKVENQGLRVALAKYFTKKKGFVLSNKKKLKHLQGTYCGVQMAAVTLGGIQAQIFAKKDPTIIVGDLEIGIGFDIGVSRACFNISPDDDYREIWKSLSERIIGENG